ncbi:MAG TPA: BrnT family toxin [Pyrinomonadaceae bacterium]|jgi:uncharacterized DUF497 family protein
MKTRRRLSKKSITSNSRLIDIFKDPCAVEFVDESHSTEMETRYAIVGLTAEYGLVCLVFTENEADAELELHFITARRAEPWMVDEYEKSKERL